MPRPHTMVLVYDADGGLVSGLIHSLKRLVAPDSTPCHLCKLTHGAFGMKSEWWDFLKGFNVPLIFYHRNELKKKHGITNLDLPGIFVPKGEKLLPWVESDEINRCKDLDALKRLIERRIAEPG
ncbi:MAG TPA: hypothetical protein PKD86_08825 [Gemmatales bacterium]|nr:hypothetical protein [Gemmatales bacterium]HMP59440.1 hypothetical protein [Gemmatales bacterium]